MANPGPGPGPGAIVMSPSASASAIGDPSSTRKQHQQLSPSKAPIPSMTPVPIPNETILRNTIRYTMSVREYEALHRYVLSRSKGLQKRVPTPDEVKDLVEGPPRQRAREQHKLAMKLKEAKGEKMDKVREEKLLRRMEQALIGNEEYSAAAVRHSIRVFIVTGVLMRIWGVVKGRLRKERPSKAQAKQPFHKSPALRLSLSLSTILLLYRILYRFLARLRAHLLDPSSGSTFRLRNPTTAQVLTSPYAPAVGASLAGLALGIYPSKKAGGGTIRSMISTYVLFRALEFGWNCAEQLGLVWGWERRGEGEPWRMRERPAWFGSWLMAPFACGQLFWTLVFEREIFPEPVAKLLLSGSSAYLTPRPKDYPAKLKWPSAREIVDSLAEMARLRWPKFSSPVLFPSKEDILPPSLAAIAPLTAQAHPVITSLSCATLHPSVASCPRAFVTNWSQSFPQLTRALFIIYSALLIPRNRGAWRKLVRNPALKSVFKALLSAMRTAGALAGGMSTAWSSLCFFNTYFPRTFLPTQRFFLSGFLAGLWAVLEAGRAKSRAVFLAAFKMAVESLWKVGVKRRWWRAMRGGDVLLFVVGLLVTGVVYETDATAVKEGVWRKGISWVRGEGWRDWGMEEEGESEEEEEPVREEYFRVRQEDLDLPDRGYA